MTSNDKRVIDTTCLQTESNSILYLAFRIITFITDITDIMDIMDLQHACPHSVSLSMETVNTKTGSKLEFSGQEFPKPAYSENQVDCKSWLYYIKSTL